jgi:hypothetical protein
MCLSRVKAIIDQALIGKMSLCEPLIRFDAWGRVLLPVSVWQQNRRVPVMYGGYRVRQPKMEGGKGHTVNYGRTGKL